MLLLEMAPSLAKFIIFIIADIISSVSSFHILFRTIFARGDLSRASFIEDDVFGVKFVPLCDKGVRCGLPMEEVYIMVDVVAIFFFFCCCFSVTLIGLLFVLALDEEDAPLPNKILACIAFSSSFILCRFLLFRMIHSSPVPRHGHPGNVADGRGFVQNLISPRPSIACGRFLGRIICAIWMIQLTLSAAMLRNYSHRSSHPSLLLL